MCHSHVAFAFLLNILCVFLKHYFACFKLSVVIGNELLFSWKLILQNAVVLLNSFSLVCVALINPFSPRSYNPRLIPLPVDGHIVSFLLQFDSILQLSCLKLLLHFGVLGLGLGCSSPWAWVGVPLPHPHLSLSASTHTRGNGVLLWFNLAFVFTTNN